jgi:hypothetical protein
MDLKAYAREETPARDCSLAQLGGVWFRFCNTITIVFRLHWYCKGNGLMRTLLGSLAVTEWENMQCSN